MILHIHSRSRTVAVVRLLRAIGPLRNRRRVPRQRQPDLIRSEYNSALQRLVVAPAQRAFAVEHGEIMRMLANERREQGRMDAGGRKDRAKELIERAANRTTQDINPRELHAVAEQFGQRTSKFNAEQLDRQVRAAIAIPLSSIEKPSKDLISDFVADNVKLIKTVPERYFDRLKEDVFKAFESGEHPETLAKRLVEVHGMAENDAMRIARDQIGKLNAHFNQNRQEGMGVGSYVWRGIMDDRERDEHREREGQRFNWDDPPEDGHPGEPVMCRCYADPDFSAILEGISQAEKGAGSE